MTAHICRTGDGRALAYRVIGSGAVVLCHGGGPGFSGRYLDDLAGLAERFTLVLLDPRGTGASDRPLDPTAYAIDDYVTDVDEVRRHLGLERVRLLGHSHGGVVAMAYAAANPRAVERLVLASTLARFHDEQEAAMQAGLQARSGEPWFPEALAALEREQAGDFAGDEELTDIVFRELPLYFARFGDAERAYLDRLRAETINADTLLLFNREIFRAFDLRPSLGRITAPTLVITGEDDFITGPVCAREIAAGVIGSRQALVPGAGHMLFVERPDRFREEVAAFLA